MNADVGSFADPRSILGSYYVLQHGTYFTTYYVVPAGVFAYGATTSDFIWTHTAVRRDPEDPLAFIEASSKFASSRKRRPCVYVPEGAAPRLAETLESNGFALQDRESWMQLDVSQPTGTLSQSHAVHLREVRTDEDADFFQELVASAFRPDYAVALQEEATQYQPHRKAHHFLFFTGGHRVGGASLYVRDSVAAIHNVAVARDAQKKGLGRAGMLGLLSIAREHAPVVYLTCEGQGWLEQFYTSVGLRTIYRRVGYVREDV